MVDSLQRIAPISLPITYNQYALQLNLLSIMLKTKTEKLRALDFTDKFNMCSYINSIKGDIDIINITDSDGIYTIFYLEKTQ